MKSHWRFLFSLLILIAGIGAARAQSYAPETFFHDPVQRVFPVEMARVLAWRENVASNAGIAEIQYTVACPGDGSAEWSFRWLDANGAVWREAKIRYAAALLRGGAQFYREVARQFLQAEAGSQGSRWAPFEPAEAAEIEGAFWEGQGGLGMSRLATLRTAMAGEAAVRHTGDAAAAARHAGVLLACALPGMNRLLTLDSTLAARGAAWLALAESGGGVGGAQRPWAVALWIARRQNQAGDVWLANNAPAAGSAGVPPADGATRRPSSEEFSNNKPAGKMPALPGAGASSQPPLVSPRDIADATPADAAIAWWNFIFTPHTPREACLQSARFDSPAWGVVMLHSMVTATGDITTFAKCLKLVADIDYDSVHDYAGEILERPLWSLNWDVFQWLRLSRREWVAALRACDAAEINAIPSVAAALEKASAPGADDLTYERLDHFSGSFRATADLLRAGYRQGAGALTPVATVTARDLLNHGWEFFGDIFGRRYPFMLAIWGDPRRSPPLTYGKEILALIPEFGVFFYGEKWDVSLPRIDNLDRLQRMEGTGCQLLTGLDTAFGVPPVFGGQINSQRAVIMAQRSWLMRDHLTWSFWGVASSPVDPKQTSAFLRQIADEGGPSVDYAALNVTTNPINAGIMSRIPDIDDLRKRFARDIPPGYMPGIWHTFQKQPNDMTLEHAQYIERTYWQGTMTPDMVSLALGFYVEVGAFDAIKLLHKRLANEMISPRAYIETVAPVPLVTALYENDPAAAREISGRMHTGPNDSPWVPLYYAIAFGNSDALEAVIKTMQLHGASNPATFTGLADLVELWRALSGNLSPVGRRALIETYAKKELRMDALALWLLARRLKLTPEESALLFSGEQLGFAAENRAYIAYYQKDRETFRAALKHLDERKPYETYTAPFSYILLRNLRREMLDQPPPENTDDPRPADWRPITDELLDIILKRIRAKTDATATTSTTATP